MKNREQAIQKRIHTIANTVCIDFICSYLQEGEKYKNLNLFKSKKELSTQNIATKKKEFIRHYNEIDSLHKELRQEYKDKPVSLSFIKKKEKYIKETIILFHDTIIDIEANKYNRQNRHNTEEENEKIQAFQDNYLSKPGAEEIKKITDWEHKKIEKKMKSEKRKKKKAQKTKVSAQTSQIIFQKGLEYYQLSGRRSQIDKNRKATYVSVTDKTIYIPDKERGINKIRELLNHEIAIHAIRGHNTTTGFPFYGIQYQEGEEGMAIFCENDVYKKTYTIGKKNRINLLCYKHGIKRVTEEWKKKYPETTKERIKELCIRKKRRYAREHPGCNARERSYFIGERKVNQHIQNIQNDEKQRKIFLKNYFSAKMGRENISDGEKTRKEHTSSDAIIPQSLIGTEIVCRINNTQNTNTWSNKLFGGKVTNKQEKIIHDIINLIDNPT